MLRSLSLEEVNYNLCTNMSVDYTQLLLLFPESQHKDYILGDVRLLPKVTAETFLFSTQQFCKVLLSYTWIIAASYLSG